ncbi:hypothetical protein PQB73_gp056 [Cronobacter phage LPCS28]|uniref:Uncharacterized protein n=1 Tax=Cronobacter phage LPCS28 TaxID=2924885 RepID=A0AAE9G5J3_9CAUD|nr:hypothetical protein PQB73_gp056 [Cronobacter phage LPCS28]UNY47157.1 hypothetical protein EHEKIMEA_00275 [Cronobacter phage LPCS28]
MQVVCSKAGENSNMTVGKAYETLYVEHKNFLDYKHPYIELIDDTGEPIGWAPCDAEHIDFETRATVLDQHGIESQIPVERLHELNTLSRSLFNDDGTSKTWQEVNEILDDYYKE